MSELTIIVPTHNRYEKLKGLLGSLLNQTLSKNKYKIVVVDDCSKDKTQKFMKEFVKKNKIISYYRLKEKSGAGYARNEGIKHVKNGYIVFIDDDCILYRNTLQEIISLLKRYPFIKCFGGDMDTLQDTNLIGRYINYGLGIRYNQKTIKIKSDLYKVNNISTFLAIYHKDIFNLKYNSQKIRFKKIFKRHEDVEFNLRLLKSGIKIHYSPKVRCIHNAENKSLFDFMKRKKLGGVDDFIIQNIHPEYPTRIPNNLKNMILFVLNIFYKPLSIIKNTELKYLIPFMYFAFIQQIAYNWGIYTAKKMADKGISIKMINQLNK